jgi:hypothetical protein
MPESDFDYPDPNWCPHCGEIIGICLSHGGCESHGRPEPWDEFDEHWDDYDFCDWCDCGHIASEKCGICGVPLCDRCFEGGAGFCHGEHTEEQIRDYARSVGLDDAGMPIEPGSDK